MNDELRGKEFAASLDPAELVPGTVAAERPNYVTCTFVIDELCTTAATLVRPRES